MFPSHAEGTMFWTAKWKKEAKFLIKGARKFVHYKRDLLPQDRIDEIGARIVDLSAALKKSDRDASEEASRQLRATCEQALPRQKPAGVIEENVEVIFVTLVVALGVRSYVVQPFRIPTGSMQPTLNGIIATVHPERDFEKPWLGQQALDWVLRSREWRQVLAPTDGRIVDVRDRSFLFFSRTQVVFDDGATLMFPAPINETMQAISGGDRIGDFRARSYHKGDVIFQGTIDGGDLVLVDKISYHFRQPKRGEVFVFDTRGIAKRIGMINHTDQQEATHYIKRLVGVPGDELRIDSPHLLVNGQVAQEPGIRHVFELNNLYARGGKGYSYAMSPLGDLVKPTDRLVLADQATVGMREYAAMGDNSGNSLDSRYWGSVKEFNLVGPALFTLWPFTTGHWGLIR